jgi:hypothetical protein
VTYKIYLATLKRIATPSLRTAALSTFTSNQKLKVSVSNPFTAFTIPTFNSKAQVEEDHHHHHHHHHLSLQTIPKKLETFCIKKCS